MSRQIIQYNFLRINAFITNNNEINSYTRKKFNTVILQWDISAYNYNLTIPSAFNDLNYKGGFAGIKETSKITPKDLARWFD